MQAQAHVSPLDATDAVLSDPAISTGDLPAVAGLQPTAQPPFTPETTGPQPVFIPHQPETESPAPLEPASLEPAPLEPVPLEPAPLEPAQSDLPQAQPPPSIPVAQPAQAQLPPQTSFDPYVVPPQAQSQNGHGPHGAPQNGSASELGPATLPHLLASQPPVVPQFIPLPAEEFIPPPAETQQPIAPEPQPAPQVPQPDHGPEAAQPRRRRATKRRLPTQKIFSDLASQAAIPPAAYAIGEDVDGAMCLVRTDEGFEVFNSAAGARHEVRVFTDEESAYFYLFGVLVADAVRTGALAPRE